MILKETIDIQKLAILVMHKKGYNLTVQRDEANNIVLYIADNDENSFYGDSFISLLGLIELGETRNKDWQLDDKEIAYTLSIVDKLYD